jgi:hypothetical protein
MLSTQRRWEHARNTVRIPVMKMTAFYSTAAEPPVVSVSVVVVVVSRLLVALTWVVNSDLPGYILDQGTACRDSYRDISQFLQYSVGRVPSLGHNNFLS